MPLTPGTHVGPYEVVGPLGAGGMGEVYRARDARLERDVALKVLPEAVSRDADRLARFEREAKAVASLSHPNILAVFDTGTAVPVPIGASPGSARETWPSRSMRLRRPPSTKGHGSRGTTGAGSRRADSARTATTRTWRSRRTGRGCSCRCRISRQGHATPGSSISAAACRPGPRYTEFSPDGRWLAYVSEESGVPDVYVTSFPSGQGKWRVSPNGGTLPRWRADGRELYYLTRPGELMAAAVRAGGASFDVDVPTLLFQTRAGIAQEW